MLIGPAAAVRADTVTLSDGRQVLGKVVSPEDSASVEVQTERGTFRYPAGLVKSVVKDDRGIPAESPAPPPATDEADRPDAGPETAEGPTTGPDATSAAGAGPARTGADVDILRFAQAKAQADQAKLAADGLAVWEKLLADSPRGSAVESARKELAAWQQRVEQDLVKFGPEWRPKSAVGDRLAKADELVARADATENVDEAAKLLDEALLVHPYRADIPFRKALRYYKAGRIRQCTMALGDATRLDPNHVAARNDLGVLAAQQKNWAAALISLSKAAAALAAVDLANTVVLDNLDLAIAAAEQDGQPPTALAPAQGQFNAIVRLMQHSGKAGGQIRWGNTWISQDEYDRHLKSGQDVDRQIADAKMRLTGLDVRYKQVQKTQADNRRRIAELSALKPTARTRAESAELDQLRLRSLDSDNELRKLEADARDIRENIDALKVRKGAAPHAEKYALLDEQLNLIDSIGAGLVTPKPPKDLDKTAAGAGPRKIDAERPRRAVVADPEQ